MLRLLGEQAAFDVPDLVTASPDPACLATRVVEGGVPLSYELVRGSIPNRVDALAAELARFLANLHAPRILALAHERLDDPLRIPEPGLQAATDELRFRFTPIIQTRQRARVRRWCDWVDEQLAAPATTCSSMATFTLTTSSGTHKSFEFFLSPTSKQAASQSPSTTSAPSPALDPGSTSSPPLSTSTWR